VIRITAGGVAALAAFFAGAGIGQSWGSSPAPAVARVSTRESAGGGSLGDRRCAAAVAERLAEIDAVRRTAYGDPVPFPDDLDPEFRPDAVQARARAVATECGDTGVKLLDIDCSEFPCLMVWDVSRMSHDWDGGWLGIDRTCPTWSSAYDSRDIEGSAELLKDANGTDLSIAVIAPYPRDWRASHVPAAVPPERRMDRRTYRTSVLLDNVRAELDARWMTQAERQIYLHRYDVEDDAE
jgi:hypothetical protein